ncbi:hypothetical protein F9278_41315 [Streptomyces phaeolivaceus]|uniref:Uncharacterized protein n=1 Tax=Streptomyces phaeolivaceus TaxID=2653200 RepID=A0A5P8KG04_9ACTN|nr:hypothetical protein [Streptomyces phaeolivaceus]QFR01558.1 hypothetical protein F9278_41315 [Streptomyces phaeolivaceus]
MYFATKPLDNPYDLAVDVDLDVYGVSFDPDPATVPEAEAGTPAAISWKAADNHAPVHGTIKGGALGSARTARPAIATGATRTTAVEVPGTASAVPGTWRSRAISHPAVWSSRWTVSARALPRVTAGSVPFAGVSPRHGSVPSPRRCGPP